MRLAMRTLIDVSLFVHTRRAWHGKQYFTLATIVVAQSDRFSVSLFPSFLHPRRSLSLSLSLSLFLFPLSSLSLALSRSLARSFILAVAAVFLSLPSFFFTRGFLRWRLSRLRQQLRQVCLICRDKHIYSFTVYSSCMS